MDPVLILGGGVHGAALARELALNQVPVCLVERQDLGYGASSKSSRLIHGGLRYLEYADFKLVREGLSERGRLLRLAPHLVRPLQLYIPVSHRTSGLWGAAVKFFGVTRWSLSKALPSVLSTGGARGLWAIRAGLSLYDQLAGSGLPAHQVHRIDEPGIPRLDRQAFRWLCSYWDGQMLAPERFILALLHDARRLAAAHRVDLRVLTYHRAQRAGALVEVFSIAGDDAPVLRLRPSLIVNTTGAWGDQTLQELGIPSSALFGGTKGSHLVTFHAGLRRTLAGAGVYAEAGDGRLVFVLPWGAATLIGTTDERFSADPGLAVATESEIDYLLQMVNEIFEDLHLTRADVRLHYSGVRPLPRADAANTAAVSRGHEIVLSQGDPPPVLTLVGGKLTTCRLVAEELSDTVFSLLKVTRAANTRDRPLPGGENHPATPAGLQREWDELAQRTGHAPAVVAATWQLIGGLARDVLASPGEMNAGQVAAGDTPSARLLADTDLPWSLVRWCLREEWVHTLCDLVERRLMLIYAPGWTRRTLVDLAQGLVEAGELPPEGVESEVERTIARLKSAYGLEVANESNSQDA